MWIEYVTNGTKRNVAEGVGKLLIARRIARPVLETRQIVPEPAIEADEISPRTGKPKRQYKRRDMAAED